jgi:signal transduction histidine kinase
MIDRIRRDLTIVYVAILALILVLFSVVVIAGFRGQTLSREDVLLTRQAEELVSKIADGEYVNDPAMNASDEYGFAVLTPDGGVSLRDSTAPALGLPNNEAGAEAAEQGETVLVTVEGPDGGSVRVAAIPEVRAGTGTSVVQVGRSMRSIREPVDRLVFVLIPIGLASLALAGIGGSFMSRRAMRPVRESFERQRAFIADASHELKTPLSLVKIDGEVLLRDPTVPDIQEILEHQLSEVDRMNALLSDLLTLARLDAGKLDVARKPFDLATVLVETAGRFRARATAERIDLEVRVPGKLPARGDAERTSQVLAALLDNALRFTPEGGRVTILGSPRADRVEATVTDTGPGIDPTQLARVFDRFHRADTQSAARTREGGGTGLGLAIAHDLSHAQNGELTADNSAGRGGKLKLTLPAGN